MAVECVEPMSIFPLDADGFEVEKPNLDDLADYGLNLVVAIRDIQEKARKDIENHEVYKHIIDDLWEALDYITVKLLQESIKQKQEENAELNN